MYNVGKSDVEIQREIYKFIKDEIDSNKETNFRDVHTFDEFYGERSLHYGVVVHCKDNTSFSLTIKSHS